MSRITSAAIDRACLGGRRRVSCIPDGREGSMDYWSGGQENPARHRVEGFLKDLHDACLASIRKLKRGGTAVFVVARRRVGGWILRLDDYIRDIMLANGLCFHAEGHRMIQRKLAPDVINAGGGSRLPDRRVRTMKEEIILVFKRT